MTETIVQANGIDICYEEFGERSDPTILLIMGLGAQMIQWPVDFVEKIVARGFHVVRFDNRDVGLSTHLLDQPVDFAALLAGGTVEPPYLLSDMAADAAGLLDAIGIERAHIVGASMGGMIAQQFAIDHPGKTRSLTSIMSTTGDPDVGQPTPEAMAVLIGEAPTTAEEAAANSRRNARVIGSPAFIDDERLGEMARAAFERCFEPTGMARQIVAIVSSGSRAEGLAALDVPTVVVHGDVDTLVTPTGGARTAELVPGAEYRVVEGMGHDLPVELYDTIIDAIAAAASRAA